MRPVSMLAAFAATIVLSAFGMVPAHAGDTTKVTHIRARDHGKFTTSPLTPPLVLTKDEATGNATHLGHYTLKASEVLNLDPRILTVTCGRFTLTAANGDTIVGTYTGALAPTSDPLVITYHVTGPITDGTGRFQGAHGYLTWDGVANLGTGLLSDHVTGWIIR